MNQEIQANCEIQERPKGKIIEIDMHYCDILVINCHDHDGKRRIFETKTEFLPGRVTAFRKQNGFMYHSMEPTIRAEQHEDEDEQVM